MPNKRSGIFHRKKGKAGNSRFGIARLNIKQLRQYRDKVPQNSKEKGRKHVGHSYFDVPDQINANAEDHYGAG